MQTAKRSTSILEIVALNSPDGRYDSLFLSNYATINLLDEVARIDGVGNVPCSAPANTPCDFGWTRRSCRRAS